MGLELHMLPLFTQLVFVGASLTFFFLRKFGRFGVFKGDVVGRRMSRHDDTSFFAGCDVRTPSSTLLIAGYGENRNNQQQRQQHLCVC